MISIGTNRLAWFKPWHGRLTYMVDTALALSFAVLAFWDAGFGVEPGVGIGLLLMTVPLAWRRAGTPGVRPGSAWVTAWTPLLVFGLVITGALIAGTHAPYVGIPAIMIAAYSVGAYCHYTLSSLAVLVGTAVFVGRIFHGDMPSVPTSAGAFLVLIPLWLAGYAIRTRQLRADDLEDKAIRLERERELATQAALAEERARIARELHDVVAHNVSMMVVQAGAALEVQTSHPEQTRAALLAIESTGRGAMTELRSLLGILSDTGEDLTLAPQPGIAQLESLVQQVREAGLPVELQVQGQQRSLPTGIELTVYRIVQEALTNALKHSGLARTEVILAYQETELKLEILDQGTVAPPPVSREPGRGLIGMRERVALYGGTIEAGPRLPSGFAVRAWLPLAGYPLAGATP
jgi:signal transduction histidine kinase